jgi:hypothetical protein
VQDDDLNRFLSSTPTFQDGIFISKGQEVKTKYVEIEKAVGTDWHRLNDGVMRDPKLQWLVWRT